MNEALSLTFYQRESLMDFLCYLFNLILQSAESFDLKRFNKNIIDPIKLIFDKMVYQSSWEEIVSNEIFC